MATKTARLATNLVGRKVHLLTDDEAKAAARLQTDLSEEEIAGITVAKWYPGILKYQKNFGTAVGEISAVHLDKDQELVYTLSFNGELVALNSMLWRLEPEEKDNVSS